MANPFSSVSVGQLPKTSIYLRMRRVPWGTPQYLTNIGVLESGPPLGNNSISLSWSFFRLSWLLRFGDRLCETNVLFSFRIIRQLLR